MITSHLLSESQHSIKQLGGSLALQGEEEYLSFRLHLWQANFTECIRTIPLNFLNHSPIMLPPGQMHEFTHPQDGFK